MASGPPNKITIALFLPSRLLLSKLILKNINNNIYLLQLGCYPVAVVILHVYKT